MKTEIKIWLDDVRPAPFGWVHCYWPDEVIRILESDEVSEISLDHDLGDDSITGYAVLLWIEEQVHTNGYIPPTMFVHSANPVAKVKMLNAIKSIETEAKVQERSKTIEKHIEKIRMDFYGEMNTTKTRAKMADILAENISMVYPDTRNLTVRCVSTPEDVDRNIVKFDVTYQ